MVQVADHQLIPGALAHLVQILQAVHAVAVAHRQDAQGLVLAGRREAGVDRLIRPQHRPRQQGAHQRQGQEEGCELPKPFFHSSVSFPRDFFVIIPIFPFWRKLFAEF